MITAKALVPGSKVALIAPSGPVEEGRLPLAVERVKEKGLEPVVYPSCRISRGYLAGDDSRRAQDFCDAFANPTIDGVICIRGGYGAQRILNLIDWNLPKVHPKRLFGYSDVTALHIVLGQRCGLISYHTPMPATEWYSGLDDYTEKWLDKALFSSFSGPIENQGPLETLCPGKVRGLLTGGNLSLVVSSIGTPYEIDTAGKILFLEDVHEEPYRIDGMLVQMKNAGKLSACAGILLGSFNHCEAQHPERSLTLQQVFNDLLVNRAVPVLCGLACGHTTPTLSLPLGACVEMDASQKNIVIFT